MKIFFKFILFIYFFLAATCGKCKFIFRSVDEKNNHQCLPRKRILISASEQVVFDTRKLPRYIPCSACSVCAKVFDRNCMRLKHEREVHFGKKRVKVELICSLCKEQFATRAMLQEHLQQTGHASFPCLFCDKQFFWELNLIKHLRVCKKAPNELCQNI